MSTQEPRTPATEVVRIDGDVYDQIREIARKCLCTDREVASHILRKGLPLVELRERRVYEIVSDDE